MPKKTSVWASLAVLSLLLLNAFALSGAPAYAATTPSCTASTDPFSVTGAAWGTAGSPESAYPGSQNVPLTIDLLFSGPCNSPQTTFQLNLLGGASPGVFTGPDGSTQPIVAASGAISANSLVSETFYLTISPNAPTSSSGVTYHIPMDIVYSDNNASYPITQVVTVPFALYNPPVLSFASTTSRLVAGETNNVDFSISNTGTGDSTQVLITVSAPSGVTVLNQIPTFQSLGPGSNASGVVELFVPSSLNGEAVTLAFTAKYLDAYENSQTLTQNLAFTVGNSVSSSSFAVVSDLWGSTATSPLPGTQDATLVVTLQYLGSSPVESLQGTVQLPAGVTDLNGRSSASAFSAATTDQYGVVQLTFYVNIGSSVQPGSYNYTLDLSWMTSQAVGLVQTAVLTPPPIAAVQSSFEVQSTIWASTTSSSACLVNCAVSSTESVPYPGTQNAHLQVSLEYLGTTPVTSVTGTLVLPPGITDVNGHPTVSAYASTVSPNAVLTLTFEVDIGSSVKPGSYSYTLDLSWLTSISSSVSLSLAQTATLMPAPIASPAPTVVVPPLSMAQQNSTVSAGSQTSAAFQLTNTGTTPIYSPTFALTVGSPLVLASIGPTMPTSQLDPGKTATFVAQVTSSPSATAGIYSGTLTVSFTNANGTSQSQTFPVSFTLQGTVILVLQDTAVSQTTTGFTVTGSILDEGSASAYYSSVSGVLGVSSATPVYLGEIDPNTPLPFSVTIPFTAPATIATSTTSTTTSGSANTTSTSRSFSRSFNFSRTFSANFSIPGGFAGFGNVSRAASGASVNIAITLTYMDTFGKTHVQAFTVPTTVRTASELSASIAPTVSSSSSSNTELKDIAYGVVAAVVVVLLVGAFMARRYRARKLASIPAEQREEQSVI